MLHQGYWYFEIVDDYDTDSLYCFEVESERVMHVSVLIVVYSVIT
jgi:hypothetical protein